MTRATSKDDKKLREVDPRKCTISKKTVNPVTAIKCTHDKYRGKDYMMYSNAVKAFSRNEMKIVGTIVNVCEACGADISHAKRVKVKPIERKVVKYNIVVRGEKSSMICMNGETIEEAEETCRIKFGDLFTSISK